ncbi:MAG: T9SS type A sorting domain-containing protein [Saprospiraceae bacterium]|nr:T9SS type A sorting domain-containing protein [Saprospiraceae bacterium]
MKNLKLLILFFINSPLLISQDFVPEPQNFKGATPLWFFYPHDVDFVRNQQNDPNSNGYNAFSPNRLHLHENELYFSVINKPHDYFGYTMFKVNSNTGILNWKYKSNYTNMSRQQLPFDMIINDDCQIEILGAKAVKGPVANPFLLLGTNVYNFEKTVLNCESGDMVENFYSDTNYNETNQTMGLWTATPFIKLADKYFYKRSFSAPRETIFFPMLNDGSINFADTSLIISDSDFVTSQINIEANRLLNIQCLLNSDEGNYCELSEITYNGQKLQRKLINDEIGSLLHKNYTNTLVNIHKVNLDYTIVDNYYEVIENQYLNKTNLIWFNNEMNVKLNIRDVAIDGHHYHTIITFYSTGQKLYSFARPSKYTSYESTGFDILEINLDGSIKDVGYIHNTNPKSVFNAISPIITDDGVLVFYSYDRVVNDLEKLVGWWTLYGFDAKQLGIDVISSTKELQSGLQIYPNPASSELTIVHRDLTLKNICIIDISGRVVLNAQPGIDETLVTLDRLSSGIYFVMATDDIGRKLHFKLIIQN